MNKLDSVSKHISSLAIREIENLSDAEIRNLSMERPFHPGQFGFMLNPKFFKTEGHLSQATFALIKRLESIQK